MNTRSVSDGQKLWFTSVGREQIRGEQEGDVSLTVGQLASEGKRRWPMLGRKEHRKWSLLAEQAQNERAAQSTAGIQRAKRSPGAYMLWLNAVGRAEARARFPDLKPTEMVSCAARFWREMSAENKAVWAARSMALVNAN